MHQSVWRVTHTDTKPRALQLQAVASLWQVGVPTALCVCGTLAAVRREVFYQVTLGRCGASHSALMTASWHQQVQTAALFCGDWNDVQRISNFKVFMNESRLPGQSRSLCTYAHACITLKKAQKTSRNS
jgi:hypothetical protein